MKTLAAVALLSAGLATGSPPPEAPQGRQLDRACHATVASVRSVVEHAATVPAQAITSAFRALRAGTLTGKIVFMVSGKSIRVAGDRFGQGFGCVEGVAVDDIGPLRNRTVSTLDETFTKPGRYALTFTLNQAGREILARLAAAQRAYRKRHPHGHRPPTISFGVGFNYETTG